MIAKIDLKKAFDSVNRRALAKYLYQLNFGPNWISAIKSILDAPRFSVLINGVPQGFFKSSVGPKQGDPLSPYLFTIIMEVFTVMINQALRHGEIEKDNRPGESEVSHLLFADDLLVFCRASDISAQGIKVLEDFKMCTGLGFNAEKSKVIFSGGCSDDRKAQILNVLDMPEGDLPIRNLGLPLIPARLSPSHCSPILENL